MSQLPRTHDVLAEHLYRKVYDICPGDSEKITGMLVQCSEKQIIEMLENQGELQKNIAKSLSFLSRNTEQLGDQLYEKVRGILDQKNTYIASKVTGMLLELGPVSVQELISNTSLLQSAVNKAKSVCGQTSKSLKCGYQAVTLDSRSQEVNMVSTASSDGNDYSVSNHNETAEIADSNQNSINVAAEEHCASIGEKCHLEDKMKERLGDILFFSIEKLYPEKAAKLTGMVLEQDMEMLQQLVSDHHKLKQCVDSAYEVLQEHNL